ncbi:hypothetical protein [Winogradskyella sp.]|uniref:hypothetical protein n=1 Tax=Winogradskyella sp. TaxID=1883156 RepID=UPI002619A6D7|nr:hypothetical protein [Winogradskyella sp.]
MRRLAFRHFAVFISIICISCINEKKDFQMSKSELLKLIDSEEHSENFIKKWNLELCSENEIKKKYCYNNALITYQIIKNDGFVLTLNSYPFNNHKYLIDELEESFKSMDLKDIDNYDKHLGEYDLSFGKYYYDDNYEIMLSVANSENGKVYVITGNIVNGISP